MHWIKYRKKQTALIVGIIVGLVVIGIVVITIICVRRQITRSKENQLRLTAKLTGLDEECEVRYEVRQTVSVLPEMVMMLADWNHHCSFLSLALWLGLFVSGLKSVFSFHFIDVRSVEMGLHDGWGIRFYPMWWHRRVSIMVSYVLWSIHGLHLALGFNQSGLPWLVN